MLSFMEEHGIYFYNWVLYLALFFHIALITADIFKRGLLSRLPVWAFTMITVPFTAFYSVMAFIVSVLYELIAGNILNGIVGCLSSSALVVISAVLYIRGNIKPVDSRSPAFEYLEKDRLEYIKSKRLIITGTLGAVLAAAVSAIIFYPSAAFIVSTIWQGDIISTIKNLIEIVLLLFIPFINIFVIIYLIAAGTIIAEICFALILIYFDLLLVTNGCIRLIARSDKTKGMKALLIILSFIPAFSIIYGIYSLKKTKERVTMYY